jgi:hypothetical protein
MRYQLAVNAPVQHAEDSADGHHYTGTNDDDYGINPDIVSQ